MAKQTRTTFESRRRRVLVLAARGNRPETVAALVSVSLSALRRDFAAELKRGPALGEARNMKRLNAAAAKGRIGALMFLAERYRDLCRADRLPALPASSKPRRLGKKEAAALDAEGAAIGTPWEGLLQ